MAIALYTRTSWWWLAGIVFSAACSANDSRSPEATQTPPPAAVSLSHATVTGTAVPGAVVEIVPVGNELPLPEGPLIMDQYSRQFIPELMFVRAGQVVEFRNSEDVDHNIQVLRQPVGTTVMNESGSKGQVFPHTFEAGSYDVVCDIHPGMRAMIVASTTPYVTMADNQGAFTLMNVPVGRYTAKTHVQGRPVAKEIEVTAPTASVSLRD
ncbi:MAG TPA: plastocyanin/azurin family copper-binding protein [Vicinamibacterales bacterium]|nr:plastocyanin/azurin family copper-binding protein [Vicinamibacterales bacterium]